MLFSLALLVAFGGSSQEIEHVKLGVDTTVTANFFPHIDRFYEGEIPVSYLGDPRGIQVVEGLKVISFSISYPYGNLNKVVPVKGNRIPEDIITDIFRNSLGEMIFITNIVTLSDENKKLHIVPMSLIPIK